MTVRLPRTLTKRCHPAFTAALVPLLISHSAEPPPTSTAGEPAPGKAASPAAPDLHTYSRLWTRSLFTTHDNPAPPPAADVPPDQASDFELSGWTRLDDRLTVYLTQLDTGRTWTLQENEPEAPDTPQLLALSGEDTILDCRAQIRINGVTAWVSLNPAASANPAPLEGAPEPAAARTHQVQEDVQPPTSIDSRAARLNGPVLLDASATYESVLTPSQTPALNAVERLRARREKLIRDFPRRSQP